MLARRAALALRLRRLERVDEHGPRPPGLDHIVDFSGHGGQNDELDFDHLAFGSGLAAGGADTGTLDASHFVANATGATTADEKFWYNTSNSTLYYDADGSGGGAAVAIAVFNNGFVLNNTDIHLI